MQAIRTRYHGPSNTRGSYISAKCSAGSARMSYEHGLDIDGNHEAAMSLLRAKLGWAKDGFPKMWSGSFGNDYYWVFLPKDHDGV